MEWVKKASFDWLNKLFVISTNERHHKTLLTDRNLVVIVWESHPYILSILPHFVPKMLVPDEHHVLKDLSFYKEARVVDAKTQQNWLDQREKKRQEGTLRQASGVSRPTTSSTAFPSTKRKSVPQLVEKELDLSPFACTPSFSFTAGTAQDSTGSPSVGANQELEPVVSCIILEPEEGEEDMTQNLRASFKERQCKCLFESLLATSLLAKRIHSKNS